jgi:hypothetical protein
VLTGVHVPAESVIGEGTSEVRLGMLARGVLDRDLWWD